MPTPPDEETPLLQSTKRSPIPWFQFSILMFIQLVEPLSSHVIYPFAPELIRNIGITNGNESHVGYYVGLMQSLFYLTEAVGVLYWSKLSDRVGRRPVILLGLAGLSISSLCFGLSTSFWTLVLSRCLCGALNGNVGVIKTMMTELTEAENLAQLWAFVPLSWSIGVTVGPVIGGYLSRPADRFPTLFGKSEFLKTYPYLLPCAFPAIFASVSAVVVFYLLDETVKSPLSISQLVSIKRGKPSSGHTHTMDKSPTLRTVLIPRVLISVGNYAVQAVVEMAFRAVQPLFFATPIQFGGLGLNPSTIGIILAVSGALGGIVQVLLFARIHRFLGPKRTFVAGALSTFPLFLTFPVASVLVKAHGYNALLWTIVGLQAILSIGYGTSFGAAFMYITASAPSKASVGATHGLSQMCISIARAIGPATANGLFSFSMEKNYLNGYLVYYILFMATCVAITFASLLPRNVWNQ